MKNVKKQKKSKTIRYRKLLERLEREFFGGNYDNFSCGNTMGLYVRNPWNCIKIFKTFNRIKNERRSRKENEGTV